ncbi:Lrp/AsnC family transcriptional regulator (plasmid) [Haloferax mediterranei ATCC 33500]|uniref:AsnC family transcriptional regulator n=1 Tax=Haloferax mediterranei (strain ATCC 33500 / DSM 1411 / JCM 8866 / NBRC 14739 / NCIMB 2177 / R-4) TaxID=523841 RepID=I3RAN3_HALMT|nr:Lrp/AsnC family transcriptional regulator [Haloferax mediterranei]AFK21293.1 transcriptional regulator [Haloferax mediterranei ATCC 33500]AHZ24611.1 AsnC family transcriptional regulator [Haloferax mediterranei ATCC 33500]ELZ97375.1 transcriptional regulator [Haloferax mediterranei ATCC 33500]MDX5990330.1 Lrp/AsnC family transcriptional regulator [Haloferax mediterranei ATCC 33500]QCQ77007.1 Lrp/AsnC family transcriptional regulator [Haloferax mediterranei ATCC 33500]
MENFNPKSVDGTAPNPDTPQAVLSNYLDEHDYEIFRALNENGRISDTELAERVGLSRTAVRRRREKLQESDVLEILAVIVLQEADLVTAQVLVTFDQHVSSDVRKEFITKLIDEGLIYNASSCLGEYDLVFSTWHADLNSLKEYVWDLFDGEQIVDDYTMIPLVKTWKAWDKELDRP